VEAIDWPVCPDRFTTTLDLASGERFSAMLPVLWQRYCPWLIAVAAVLLAVKRLIGRR
jgi:hypothetical protein